MFLRRIATKRPSFPPGEASDRLAFWSLRLAPAAGADTDGEWNLAQILHGGVLNHVVFADGKNGLTHGLGELNLLLPSCLEGLARRAGEPFSWISPGQPMPTKGARLIPLFPADVARSLSMVISSQRHALEALSRLSLTNRREPLCVGHAVKQ
jgi:hypothetical protein